MREAPFTRLLLVFLFCQQRVAAFVVAAFLWGIASPAEAGRLALVVGLDSYDHIPSLHNAAADAQAMAQALRDVGYDLVRVIQPRRGLRDLKDDIRAFSERIQGGDEVVLYFSGHGVQIDGDNYLLPSDVRAQGEAQVRDDALSLGRVLRDLRAQRPSFTLAIVDACRDNPFGGQGRNIGGRGLTGVAGAVGQMVIYAAGEGQQALDRLGKDDTIRNGVFTRVFVDEMKRPGVKVQDVLQSVRQRVHELARKVNHTQVPAIYDQVLGTFYFVPPATLGSAPAIRPIDLESEAWDLCKSGRTVGPCRRYLDQYAAGRYAALARTRIEDIEPSPAPLHTEPASTGPVASSAQKHSASPPAQGSVAYTRLKYRVTDLYTSLARDVTLTVTRRSPDVIEFDNGRRVERLDGKLEGTSIGELGSADQYQPPAGWWPPEFDSTTEIRTQYDTPAGAKVEFTATVDKSTQTLSVGGRTLSVRHALVRGTAFIRSHMSARHELRCEIWYSPELKRIVRMQSQLRGPPQSSSFNADARELLDLVAFDAPS